MSQSVTDPASDNHGKVIAFCIEELSVGGAENMLMLMANEFVERGWRVHMICLRQAGELSKGLSQSVTVHVLDKKLGVDVRLPQRYARCINDIQPDVVNSHLWVANLWTRVSLLLQKTPIIVTEHSRDSWKRGLHRWLDRRLAFRTYRLVTVSADTANFYRQEVGIKDSLINVITNGVDTQVYASGNGQALRKTWAESTQESGDTQEGALIVGTIGRLVAAKNHRRLIDAFARLLTNRSIPGHAELKLIIVGDGEDRSNLQSYIDKRDLGDRILMTGERHDIPDMLAAFDLFVLSSDREGYPLTALEAQAAATAVVLTDAGGSGESIAVQGDESGGLLVDKDTEALAQAMASLLSDDDLRARKARFAQQYALEHFDKRHMIERYESLFNEAIRARKSTN